jgi:hypothetical protein
VLDEAVLMRAVGGPAVMRGQLGRLLQAAQDPKVTIQVLPGANWRKSSYSGKEGGDCVEVAEGFPGAARWRKSTSSNDSGGACVKVADGLPGVVPVRDSKDPRGPVLVFPARDWSAFIASVQADRLA